jgi:hypothetical protein
MPTWGHILAEINEVGAAWMKLPPHEQAARGSPFDQIRRKYLTLAALHTRRPTILYATKFTQPALPGQPVPPDFVSITNEDIQGFMEAVHKIGGGSLDLILHSPGGSGEAAEAIVTYLRSKFTNIRVIVPQLAKSAATMLACAADTVVMGNHSFLVDPQLVLGTALGVRLVPAQAIIEQFEKAKKECNDPANLRAWLPMLSQYGPDLLVACQNASSMSKDLVRQWLSTYMFKGEADGQQKADAIAGWLAEHSTFRSHGRHISRDELREKGMKITALEDDQKAQDLLLSVFHAVSHTFTSSGAVKIIENHQGKAFVKMINQIVVAPPGTAPPAPQA